MSDMDHSSTSLFTTVHFHIPCSFPKKGENLPKIYMNYNFTSCDKDRQNQNLWVYYIFLQKLPVFSSY